MSYFCPWSKMLTKYTFFLSMGHFSDICQDILWRTSWSIVQVSHKQYPFKILGLFNLCQTFCIFRNWGKIIQVQVLGLPQNDFGSFYAIQVIEGDNGGLYAAYYSYALENRYILYQELEINSEGQGEANWFIKHCNKCAPVTMLVTWNIPRKFGTSQKSNLWLLYAFLAFKGAGPP